MILYHGSYTEVKKRDIGFSRRNLDFEEDFMSHQYMNRQGNGHLDLRKNVAGVLYQNIFLMI